MTQALTLVEPRGKRLFDITLCLVAMPIVLPVLGIVALLVWLDSPGPIVFRQMRTGRDGHRFAMYKFRTMVRDAEALKATLAHLNILPAPDFKIPNDPRITRVGRFLRKSSLDELPQLFNVLAGDMSVVGPRPTSFAPSTYSLWHTARLEVRPGITGRWQIMGRNGSTFDERLRMDIAYIRSMSIREDIRIIIMTVMSVVRRSGE
ncbi:MAG: sugar transferase [Candidatus Limnocylindrales bacterium]